MAEIRYEAIGGAPHPAGTEELFIGPSRVRVIVHTPEEKQFWLDAHEREMAAAAAPVAEPVSQEPTEEIDYTDPEPITAPEPVAEPEPTIESEPEPPQKRRGRKPIQS